MLHRITPHLFTTPKPWNPPSPAVNPKDDSEEGHPQTLESGLKTDTFQKASDKPIPLSEKHNTHYGPIRHKRSHEHRYQPYPPIVNKPRAAKAQKNQH
ncbi:hypothetical protein [Vampirovibrio sp.]|uniref:hypothetical protein n=1 Tax=Vampirovibrio sp. TaxID=2717857 RepID=UPI003593ED61